MMALPDPVPEINAAIKQGRPEIAEALARRAFANGQGTLAVAAQLATALRHQGRHHEAKAIMLRLVDEAPHNLSLRFDLSEILLLLGEFERGWREYRFRYSLPHTTMLGRKVQKPRWEGEPLAGKTLLIFDEQGYGDTFQFMRLVAQAKERSGARIVLQIVERQAGFARRMNVADVIITREQSPPPFDCYCEMMSLPMAMGLKLRDLPGPVPYLSPDPARLSLWRERLAGLPRPLVALVWAGRPEHFNDAHRSLHLEDFAGLAMDGVTFVSVQKGPRASEAQTPPPGLNIIDLDATNADFEDTAAILALTDLLISVDTSPAHLAGALGLPTWLMLPFVPDWRWLTERTDTPWYPNHRLIRQRAPGKWNDVIQEIAAMLKAFRDGDIAPRPAPPPT